METAISNLSILPETKEQRNLFVSKILNEIKSGNADVLKFWKQITNLEQMIKEIKKTEVKDIAINAADKHPEKSFPYAGAIIEKATKTMYDYSECGDSYYNDLINQKEILDTKIKERETMLQSIKDVMYSETTGEEIRPAIRTYTDYLKVTVK